MVSKIGKKTYTVKDLYKEANNLLKDELQGLRKKPLSKSEETKMNELAKLISNTVLKEMKVV